MAVFSPPSSPGEALIPLISYCASAGEGAASVFHFVPLRRYEIVALQSACDVANATDKLTVSLVHVTVAETLITGTVIAANDTVVTITSMDSGKSAILEAGHQYNLVATIAGTPATVKGATATLWVKVASHD